MDADDLYRLPPEDFTAARDAAAKERRAAGDKDGAAELKALRRPSVAAWLVNLLAHEEQELLEQLLSLGPALAEAQAQGQGDELRELSAQRRQLVDAVADSAVELGGRDVAAAVREEVRSTLEAALADASSAEAVRSGRLVRSLSYAGFGGVDLDGAVAVLRGPTRARAARNTQSEEVVDGRATQVAEAQAAALDAAGALDDAVRACERAEQARGAAEQQAEQARQELARLQEAVRQAERAVREADAARHAAEEESERAVRLVERRQAAEQEARAALDRLRRGAD